MTRKRKQDDISALDGFTKKQFSKRRKVGNDTTKSQHRIDHGTLRLFFPTVSTLRQYLLSKLPMSAKKRRHRLANLGESSNVPESSQNSLFGSRIFKDASSSSSRQRALSSVASILDNTYVCSQGNANQVSQEDFEKDFISFSQGASKDADRNRLGSSMSISDIVDYVIWLLFNRIHRNNARPPHLLCHGFQRAQPPRAEEENRQVSTGVFGLSMRFLNRNVSVLKSATWDAILVMLGQGGDKVVLDLLLECNMFVRLSSESSNLSQLSGTPLQDIRPIAQIRAQEPNASTSPNKKLAPTAKKLTSVVFVRSRAYHARPALNAKGRVTFGLRHIHALNRYRDPDNSSHTVHLAKYIFPRQYGLHNAFTSKVDPKETAQPFKDYTLREHEIVLHERALVRGGKRRSGIENRTPKRLRGEPLALIRRLQKLNSRCSYFALLQHYCPCQGVHNDGGALNLAAEQLAYDPTAEAVALSRQAQTQKSKASQGHCQVSNTAPAQPRNASANVITDLATPDSQVSAFCRAVISSIVPHQFWGDGDPGKENRMAVMQCIDRFIRLRKFESMSLHAVMQGIKIRCIAWLVPPQHQGLKTALSDLQKRREIFAEFMYYVFDSILIPLIRSTFHLTESSAHQNRLFYFRHDVWRDVTEPAMADLKSCVYEEMTFVKAKRLLDSRTLGFSQVRMIPKASGMRPIINLRRRITKLHKGRATLGRSVNSLLSPVFNVLDLERKMQPDRLGSSLFSVNDIHSKIREFRTMFQNKQQGLPKFYFAKVDAKSCFDTIPQEAVTKLIRSMVNGHEYRLARHAEIKNDKSHYYQRDGCPRTRPAMKFLSTARASNDFQDFDTWVGGERVKHHKEAVFVDAIVQHCQSTQMLLKLLGEHIQSNIVKIGKKFFRQKTGIPQGSVLSSLLCNFFYGELEQKHLAFLNDGESLLLRLIDDFLVITRHKEKAQRFLQVMSAGIAEYGVEVNLTKSLASFPVELHGCKVPQVSSLNDTFPYCGVLIDMTTLEIKKDRERRRATVLADALSVEQFRTPGRAFYRKALSSFKVQSLRMLTDTNFNKPTTVLCTVYQNFSETAMKFFRYSKCMLGGSGRPPFSLAIGTIRDLINVAFVLLTARNEGHTARGGYNCSISKRQVAWLAIEAFHRVLSRKQTQYRDVLAWLNTVAREEVPISQREIARLEGVAAKGDKAFDGYKF